MEGKLVKVVKARTWVRTGVKYIGLLLGKIFVLENDRIFHLTT